MNGILYGVGVGPGDPELLTLKALKVLRSADVVACPEKDGKAGVAFGIAEKVCPEIASAEKLLLSFPMKKDDLDAFHNSAASAIASVLLSGRNVAFLTLGDTGFYSTFYYVADILKSQGFTVEVVPGIPSFCAASAALRVPLVLGDEPVLVTAGEFADFDGTLVILKAGGKLASLKESISGVCPDSSVYLVTNCGMEDEQVTEGLENLPDSAGYFSILIVKR
ncbi:MAG: precorrin-2 C(20)-methyltransferase [Clostridia bacterium]|jgi:precorrin-2/cobalt-factor-2 C20-methyltransferase|nr:precorrin-2 C(20)-methyltransferase [Clostridia bacterium]MBQ1895390.1 precorrin-2 C(20)-methyltransferase [Clostridia bacterium]MBQ2092600.1 precorrin-2 C(20)-methyltransferase [Clostridia bacterium]MBQ3898027.1 precorrin-2 C(20)-methyltransferase [Clostridia bacterium]